MQIANCLVSLAGDVGNQVPKYGVTAAEIAVLNAIHGDGACLDIQPAGNIVRTHREERGRLLSIYGKVQDGNDTSPVSRLFPGAAARVFETLDELDLPQESYKAKTRLTANDTPDEPVKAVTLVVQDDVAVEDEPTPAQKKAAAKAAKSAIKERSELAQQQAARVGQITAGQSQQTEQMQARSEVDEDNADEGEINDEHSEKNSVLG